MKKINKAIQNIFYFIIFSFFLNSSAQSANQTTNFSNQKGDFWKNVRFGGGLGLSFGSGFTDISVSPSAIYQFNEYFAAGVALQGSYIKSKDNYEAYTYGGSIIALANPINEIQISAEIEQLRVNFKAHDGYIRNSWNTALFLGAGYRTGNATIGVRYNVLHNNKNNVYNESLMPFIRVYF